MKTTLTNAVHERTKTKKKMTVSQAAVENEQRTINALIYNKRLKKGEISTEENRRRMILITVSRYIANSKTIIESSGF